MSATSEKLLLQVIELEQQVTLNKSLGKDTKNLEEQLEVLRNQLINLNESLANPKTVLKG